MKIKINKKAKGKTSKIFKKGIKLPSNLRLILLGFLIVLLLICAGMAYGAYQQPETTTESVVNTSYTQTGKFDYIVYLKNNTVYGGKTTLEPREGKIFSNLVENINASFSYTFSISKNAEIDGNYEIRASLNTDNWNKTIVLKPTTQFTSSSQTKTISVNYDFPLDLDYYTEIVSKIDEETGINTPSPVVNIQASVRVSAQTSDETIIKSFTHMLSVPLTGKTIDIDDTTLTSQISGVTTEKQQVYHANVANEKSKWTNLSILFIILAVLSMVVTRSDKKKLSKTEKAVKKIKKKYGEWIVQVDQIPKRPIGTDTVFMKSLDDLIKTSEELGKPILYHLAESTSTHSFHVIDDTIHYQFILSEEG